MLRLLHCDKRYNQHAKLDLAKVFHRCILPQNLKTRIFAVTITVAKCSIYGQYNSRDGIKTLFTRSYQAANNTFNSKTMSIYLGFSIIENQW